MSIEYLHPGANASRARVALFATALTLAVAVPPAYLISRERFPGRRALLNGSIVRGADQPRFDTSKLKRGDRLQARVRVSDGEAESPFAETMTLELANRAAIQRELELFISELSVVLARLPRLSPSPSFDPRFTSDRFGVAVHCAPERAASVREILRSGGAEEVRG